MQSTKRYTLQLFERRCAGAFRVSFGVWPGRACHECGKTDDILLCNGCGLIAHTSWIWSHGFRCRECGKTVCGVCVWKTRRLLVFSKRFCSDCRPEGAKRQDGRWPRRIDVHAGAAHGVVLTCGRVVRAGPDQTGLWMNCHRCDDRRSFVATRVMSAAGPSAQPLRRPCASYARLHSCLTLHRQAEPRRSEPTGRSTTCDAYATSKSPLVTNTATESLDRDARPYDMWLP